MNNPKPARVTPPKLNKSDLVILEKCFAGEIEAALKDNLLLRLVQTRSKRAPALVEAGFLESKTVTLPGWPPVKITGYILTPLGHWTYCANC